MRWHSCCTERECWQVLLLATLERQERSQGSAKENWQSQENTRNGRTRTVWASSNWTGPGVFLQVQEEMCAGKERFSLASAMFSLVVGTDSNLSHCRTALWDNGIHDQSFQVSESQVASLAFVLKLNHVFFWLRSRIWFPSQCLTASFVFVMTDGSMSGASWPQPLAIPNWKRWDVCCVALLI